MIKGARVHSFLVYLCSTSAIAFTAGVVMLQYGRAQGWNDYAATDLAEDMRGKLAVRLKIHDSLNLLVDQPPEKKHVAKHVAMTSQHAYKQRLDRLFCDPLDDDPEHFAERMSAMFRIRCPPTRGAFPTIKSNMQFIPCVGDGHEHPKHEMPSTPVCWQEHPPVVVEPLLLEHPHSETPPPRKVRHVGNFGKRGKAVKASMGEVYGEAQPTETDAGLLPKKEPIKPPDPKSFHRGAAIVGPQPDAVYDALHCRNCNMSLNRTDLCDRANCPVNYAKAFKDKVQTDDIQDS